MAMRSAARPVSGRRMDDWSLRRCRSAEFSPGFTVPPLTRKTTRRQPFDGTGFGSGMRVCGCHASGVLTGGPALGGVGGGDASGMGGAELGLGLALGPAASASGAFAGRSVDGVGADGGVPSTSDRGVWVDVLVDLESKELLPTVTVVCRSASPGYGGRSWPSHPMRRSEQNPTI
jgi:hypothetical protein